MNSSSLVDDADQFCQRSTVVFDDEVPDVWKQFKSQCPLEPTVVRVCPVYNASKDKELTVAMFVPSLLQQEEDVDKYARYSYFAGKLELKVESVLTPPIRCAEGSRRWREGYQHPPLPKKERRRMRLTLVDGILEVLRSAKQGYFTTVIAHGEGALVIATALGEGARRICYTERHVGSKEIEELEAIVAALKHVVLFAPTGHPPRSFLPLLRDFMPEVAVISPSNLNASVLVVVPVHGAAAETVRAFALSIRGAVTHECKFAGPAYRSVPVSGYEFPAFPAPPKRVDANMSSRSRVFVELMAGSANLSREHLRVGFTCKAYERSPQENLPYPEEGDLSVLANQKEVAFEISERSVFHAHMGPDCSSFSRLSALGGTSTRTKENPAGDGTKASEVEGNRGLALAIIFICYCLNHGVFFAMEHPRGSKAWSFPFFLWLFALSGTVFILDYDGCAWGLRPADWIPAHGDIRAQKSSLLVTSNQYLSVIKRKCQDVSNHRHEPIIGADAQGQPRSKGASPYPVSFCQEYARAWLQRAEPKIVKFNFPTLEFLLKNPLWSPADLGPVQRPLTQRPVNSETGAPDSSSSLSGAPGPAAPLVELKTEDVASPAANPEPENDYWFETAKTWVRVHVKPRFILFHPFEGPSGPLTEPGGPVRGAIIHKRLTSPLKAHPIKDEWTNAFNAHRSLQNSGQAALCF